MIARWNDCAAFSDANECLASGSAALACLTVGIESPVHLLFIGVVVLIVLGPKRLPELARALGKGMREFREAIGEGSSHEEQHDRD
jgi:TatA/E family protein of Tat protein translocase